ncbi:MAG: 4-hydroxythreonine-4-phosphate dehydrogenase PdxA [Rhodospirillaceae bacterium]|nr:4-hydroxythreonine-4-phosphate dehydrogenase PdxA [Rhodospirillaceae bacterium]
MNGSAVPPIALTMGEPAGIGGEITLKAWLRRNEGVPPFFAIDDAGRLQRLASQIGLSVPVRSVATAAAAAPVFKDALPVLPVGVGLSASSNAEPVAANAAAVVSSIDQALALTLGGEAAALVTNPIHKRTLYDSGFRHPGHTEYLAAKAGGGSLPVMMLVGGGLRVVPVTIHQSLRSAIIGLKSEDIVFAGRVTARALGEDFGSQRRVVAVAALNPHGGEDGAFGDEEIEIIAPAVAALRESGVEVFGPLPADTLFHAAARQRYDAVLCMYHDQALIPLKTLAFESGANVTLGLPFVRTSPDHGTAFDIAGTGLANPESLMAALKLAAEIAARRRASVRRPTLV